MGEVVNRLVPVPAASRRAVTARLIAPIGWYTDTDGIAEVVTTWTATVDDEGAWSLTLPQNSSYTAEGTWYSITQPGSRHAAVVPTGAGPFQLHDIEIAEPSAPPCCPPPPAGWPDGGELVTRVGALEMSDSEQAGRLNDLEIVDGDFATRIAALEASTGVASLSYRHTQAAPALLVQINHGLPFRPAGVLCTDTLDQLCEPDRITNPLPGTTEITFGASFTGVIDLS